jgi:hypothetical protein
MKVTNQQLISCYEQLVDMKRNGSVLSYILSSKIRQWENDNMVRINGILEKMKEIDMEYWQHTAVDGRIEYTMVDGADGKREPVLKDGKDRQDFEKAYQDLLGQETTMVL